MNAFWAATLLIPATVITSAAFAATSTGRKVADWIAEGRDPRNHAPVVRPGLAPHCHITRRPYDQDKDPR
jgi:hypothetical protein